MIPTSKECKASLLAVYRNHETFSADPYAVTVSIQALVALVMQRMSITPGEWTKASEKIRSHIQFQAKDPKGFMIITRGKNGGCRLKEGTRL